MISLIVATYCRVSELDRLLCSLDKQTHTDFEVLVIDQNSDNRLDPILEGHEGLRLRRLRSAIGVSKARNLGIREAQGTVIAFPDDDCWYPPDLLGDVQGWLDTMSDYEGLLTATRDEQGRLQAPKLPPRSGPCTKRSILGCAVAFNAFLRKDLVDAIGFFREDIGPGTPSPFQSGEDIDYLIRPIAEGRRVFYDSTLTVFHPRFDSRERLRRVVYPYSLGIGHLLRDHGYSCFYLAEVLGRSIGGAMVKLIKADLEGAHLYALRALGQFRGYTARRETPP